MDKNTVRSVSYLACQMLQPVCLMFGFHWRDHFTLVHGKNVLKKEYLLLHSSFCRGGAPRVLGRGIVYVTVFRSPATLAAALRLQGLTWCVSFGCLTKQWYGCLCLRFLTCAQMLMPATACGQKPQERLHEKPTLETAPLPL